jgi:phospholipid/cholesterol/gamma-HCH transport system permease protein
MIAATEAKIGGCALSYSRATNGTLVLELTGSWTLQGHPPSADEVRKRIESETTVQKLDFDTRDVTGWDSGLLVFVLNVRKICAGKEIDMDVGGLPAGVRKLIDLAAAVPERKGARRGEERESLLEQVGKGWLDVVRSGGDIVEFLGEAVVSFGRLLAGKARFRRADFVVVIQECGAQALPIVSLISILVGLILAFVGAVQLEQFGAQIFVANLVGIATAREMGAMMTGIIMAGRTGAAFAAQLGTMQVNEEIDALKTLGFSPMDFLVLPRMMALIVMMPLLTLYACLLGILGGMIVGVGMLDLTMTQYIHQTQSALGLNDFAYGLVKSSVFGVLIAISGCLRGIQCGRSASAVGDAATSAVVMAIILIIVTDGLFAVVSNVVGF